VICKLVGALVLITIAGWLIGGCYSRFRRVGENGAEVWSYDQQRKLLYTVPRDTIPPDNDRRGGVRAVVVAFRGEENDPKKRCIAYMETYGYAQHFEPAHAWH